MIYLKRNGGVDHQIAPGQRVVIHGKKGLVKAVFGWPAIHTRISSPEKETSPKVENVFLDTGARSKKEIEELGVHVGCVVTYQDGFDELAYGYFVGRAFDNRVGGFMIAEVARMIKENKKKLPYSLYIVNAVQEEVGLRGADSRVNCRPSKHCFYQSFFTVNNYSLTRGYLVIYAAISF